MKQDEVSAWLPLGIHLFGVALMLTAAIDLMTTVWPVRPTEISWRYGFLGLSAGYLQTPTLGLLLIAGTALWRHQPNVMRAAGIVSLVTAVVLVLVMAMFGLDVLQIRELRSDDLQSTVLAGGLFQEVKFFVAMLVFLMLGLGCLRTVRDTEWNRSAGGHPGIVATPRRSA